MEPITWLVIGVIAGWLAGLLMKGNGYGLGPCWLDARPPEAGAMLGETRFDDRLSQSAPGKEVAALPV